jgi:hypothetical protein
VDDRKVMRHGSIKNTTSQRHVYARSILAVTIGHTDASLFGNDITNQAWVELVCELIDLVSAAHNGNTCTLIDSERWKLIPRWADRIEALGVYGARRCWQVAHRLGNPMFCHDTPLILDAALLTRDELNARFAAYVARGGSSASMLDHYTDKLLSLAHVPECQNDYLCQQLAQGDAILRRILVQLNLLRQAGKLPRIIDHTTHAIIEELLRQV